MRIYFIQKLVDTKHWKAFSAQYPLSVCKYSMGERMWVMVALTMRFNFSCNEDNIYIHKITLVDI